jgi:hypothetical protein
MFVPKPIIKNVIMSITGTMKKHIELLLRVSL